MKRRTIFIGLGVFALLLTVGIAAATLDEEINDRMPGERSGRGGCGMEGGEFGKMYGMNGTCEAGDLDNDSIPNCEDFDDDGDGINDTEDEYPRDHDNDGIPDVRDDDDDNDGIPDSEDDYYVGNCSGGEGPGQQRLGEMMRERLHIFMNNDLDNDGIANCEDPDDDGDGINDTEDEYPHDHDNDGIPDGRDDDDDNDGIPDDEDDDYVGNTPEMKDRREMRKNHRRGHGGGGQEGQKGKGGGC